MRVLIAGGGTGGHIYPALAIAKAIREMDKSAVIEFVGTPAGLESSLVPSAGFKLHFISIGRLNKNVSLVERIKTFFALPIALIKSFRLLREFRPQVVMGVGGYASGPVVLMAALMRIRTLIWEPNAFPGLANRILARFVDECLVVFGDSAKYLRNRNIQPVSMPVRKEIEEAGLSRNRDSHNFRVLIFGGSQGARAINSVVLSAFELSGQNGLKNIEVVHQTGSADFDRVKKAYQEMGLLSEGIQVFEYLHDMPERYHWADLVISRAGTGTISELAACGKAALLIPLPTAADDHQTKNAEALVNAGGAELIKQNELTPQRLIQEIEDLKMHPEIIFGLEKNIRRFYKQQGAQEIAKIVMGMGETHVGAHGR